MKTKTLREFSTFVRIACLLATLCLSANAIAKPSAELQTHQDERHSTNSSEEFRQGQNDSQQRIQRMTWKRLILAPARAFIRSVEHLLFEIASFSQDDLRCAAADVAHCGNNKHSRRMRAPP